MEQLELREIQGFLLREYKERKCSKYFLLQITDATNAKRFISEISVSITNATDELKDICINIGFTSKGLHRLGMHENNLRSFIREFREGMVTPHRQRLLGDHDSSDPQNWKWGGPANEAVDIILMVFAVDEEAINIYGKDLNEKLEDHGLKEVFHLEGQILPEGRENFGFKDGISQPAIIGSGIKGINNNNIKPGEFLLGYKNEYDVYPDTPLLNQEQGDIKMLPLDAGGTGQKDLGRNGTFFVLRQLKEDVKGFWDFLNEKSKNDDGSLNTEESIKLAAKMMGRWPGGAPLVKFPDKDPQIISDDDDFNYIDTDKHGLKCPFGAHMRRTNPRDNFEETGPVESLKLTRKHRIMRRVRSYGEPFIGSPTNNEPNGEVGLLFGCFNADISRQFEFIQYTWANYPKFKQLYADPDPFIGVRENPEPGTVQNFTIPQQTANKYITGLKSFVTVRGGGYFFFPSITTIKYLATI